MYQLTPTRLANIAEAALLSCVQGNSARDELTELLLPILDYYYLSSHADSKTPDLVEDSVEKIRAEMSLAQADVPLALQDLDLMRHSSETLNAWLFPESLEFVFDRVREAQALLEVAKGLEDLGVTELGGTYVLEEADVFALQGHEWGIA